MQDISKEQQETINKINEHRKEKVEELAYKMLALSLEKNIPVFDLPYYILQRSRAIIGDSFRDSIYKDKKLRKAQKAYLKEYLRAVRENIKVAEQKEVKDETDERDNRCEPLAQSLVEMLLDEELVFSDEDFFNKILENEDAVVLSSAVGGYAEALDEKLLMVISEHWRKATEKMFGVEKEKLTFSQLDDILKSA